MKTNVGINLTDEQRRTIHENFYGGKKGMISRKDVNTICQTAITDWLMGRNNGPETVVSDMGIEVEMKPLLDALAPDDEIDPDNFTEQQVRDVMKQNELLLTRVNQLQHKLDTIKRK